MTPSHEEIIVEAIRNRRRLKLTFYSKEDGASLVRSCAPMDVGPSRRARDKSVRFHFWDFDSDAGSHTLSLLRAQVVAVETMAEVFDPGAFITWDTQQSPWFVKRDWGRFS